MACRVLVAIHAPDGDSGLSRYCGPIASSAASCSVLASPASLASCSAFTQACAARESPGNSFAARRYASAAAGWSLAAAFCSPCLKTATTMRPSSFSCCFAPAKLGSFLSRRAQVWMLS